MNKIAVITASIGGIDIPKTIPKQSIEFDLFNFTDKNMPYPCMGLDNRLKAKLFKMQAHKLFPDHDIIIWVDGNVQIRSHDFIENMVKHLTEDSDVVISKHPARKCIYKETDFIIREIKKGNTYLSTRYNPEALMKEANYFMSQGIKVNTGLYWCGLFARRNNAKVNAFFDSWWNDNILWSNFDQTNFVALQLKQNIKLSLIDWGEFYKNDSYELIHHSKLM